MVHWYGGADGPLVLRSPRASNFPEAIADRLKIGKLLIPLTKAGHLALVFTALKSWLEKFGNNSKNRPKNSKNTGGSESINAPWHQWRVGIAATSAVLFSAAAFRQGWSGAELTYTSEQVP